MLTAVKRCSHRTDEAPLLRYNQQTGKRTTTQAPTVHHVSQRHEEQLSKATKTQTGKKDGPFCSRGAFLPLLCALLTRMELSLRF
jgi:hypothetical protein